MINNQTVWLEGGGLLDLTSIFSGDEQKVNTIPLVVTLSEGANDIEVVVKLWGCIHGCRNRQIIVKVLPCVFFLVCPFFLIREPHLFFFLFPFSSGFSIASSIHLSSFHHLPPSLFAHEPNSLSSLSLCLSPLWMLLFQVSFSFFSLFLIFFFGFCFSFLFFLFFFFFSFFSFFFFFSSFYFIFHFSEFDKPPSIHPSIHPSPQTKKWFRLKKKEKKKNNKKLQHVIYLSSGPIDRWGFWSTFSI